MYLGARVLAAVSDKNNHEFATEWRHRQLSADKLYVQLVDLEHNRAGNPEGIRYMPTAPATMNVTLGSIDASLAKTYVATQPFAQDPSIWLVSVLATDDFGEGDIEIELTEAGVVRKARIQGGVSVDSDSPSFC